MCEKIKYTKPIVSVESQKRRMEFCINKLLGEKSPLSREEAETLLDDYAKNIKLVWEENKDYLITNLIEIALDSLDRKDLMEEKVYNYQKEVKELGRKVNNGRVKQLENKLSLKKETIKDLKKQLNKKDKEIAKWKLKLSMGR